MNRGLYIAGTGMLTQRQRMNVITNNIANAETVGFKSDDMITKSFNEVLEQRLNERNPIRGANAGVLGYGLHIDETCTDFEQGNMETTGEDTDFAIAGDGFFVIETPQGNRYTRAGNFSITAEGALVTPEGWYVLSDAGERITVATKDIEVDEQGNVFEKYPTPEGDVGAAETTPVGRIGVVNFADLTAVRKAGDNLFTAPNPQAANNYAIKQGFLEGSNINVAREVSDMIITSRAFDANQRIAKMIDETLQKTVNNIADF